MRSKSGIEVVGLAMNVITIVETVIKLLVALQEAQERHHDLPRILQEYRKQLQNTREIVEIILSEDALHIATIMSDLNDLDDFANSLKQELDEMSKERNPFQQYTHQLLKGSKDTTRLSGIMKGLNLSKDSLVLKIQVVHVGLTKAYGNAIETLSSILEHLRLAEFPKNRQVQTGENLVCIEFPNLNPMEPYREADAGLAEDGERNMDVVARDGITRDVIENECGDDAFMLNGPIGKERAKRLTIRGNKARNQSMMLNHGIEWKYLKRMRPMQQGKPDSGDSGDEGASDEHCRRRRKTGKGARRTLARENEYPQQQGA